MRSTSREYLPTLRERVDHGELLPKLSQANARASAGRFLHGLAAEFTYPNRFMVRFRSGFQ